MTIAHPVRVGVVDPAGAATPLIADAANPPFTAPPVRVTLSKAFAQECPPGWPAPPDQVGTGGGGAWYPRTIAQGTTITTFACIANALVAANAATVV